MNKNILGSMIQSLRKDRGITQEELGKAIGVTAQAVSNWECGGMPDAGLLPDIANYFGVSIDYLYGRTDEIKEDPGKEVLWDLYHTKSEERFEKAYQYCWCIQQGLFDMEPELLTNALQERIAIPDSTKTSSVLLFEEGVTYMRVNKDVHSFFLMPRPEEGFLSKLSKPEQYEHFFSMLGKKGRVKALLSIYSRKARAFTSDRLAERLEMPREEVKEILEDLCFLKLIETLEIDVEEGDSTYYRAIEHYSHIVSLIPFLFTSSDLIERAACNFNNTSQTVTTIL